MAPAVCRQVRGLADLTAMPAGAALGLFCPPAARPLGGVAGWVDWRLCGALSQARQAGLMGGERGEVLLMPATGRLAPGRIFLFGLGGGCPADEAALASLVVQAVETMARAGAAAVALAVPCIAGDGDLPRRFIAACRRAPAGAIVELLCAEEAAAA